MKSIRTKLSNLKKPISRSSKLSVAVEKRHVQAHLALTELRLRIRSVGYQEPNSNRSVVLDILHNYWRKGIFPKNTYRTLERTPVFIDGDGVHCAVGYLMAQTGYGNLAMQINDTDRFAMVEQLESPEVGQWLQRYGITKNEAAIVQPGYGGFVIEKVSYSIQDKFFGVLSLAACLVLLAFLVIALQLMTNKTLSKPKKHNHFLKMAVASVAIIIGLALFLPTPKQAVEALTSGAANTEKITCSGWSAPKNQRPSVCNEFEQKGSVPGWREVPCEGICIM